MNKLVQEIYKSKNQFILVGLTGKTGSGCSTVAEILNKGYKEYKSVNEDEKIIQQKKDRIVKDFSKKNFKNKSFYTIKPSTILMMIFILEKSIFVQEIKKLKTLLDANTNLKEIQKLCSKILDMYNVFTKLNFKNKFKKDKEFVKLLKNFDMTKKDKLISLINKNKQNYESKLSTQTLKSFIKDLELFLGIEIDKKWLKKYKNEYIRINNDTSNIEKFKKKFIKKIELKALITNDILEDMAKNNHAQFIKLYEKFDNVIKRHRKTKTIKIKTLQNIGDLVRKNIHIFELPKYVNFVIKALRAKAKTEKTECFIAIDSLKNPFEIVYFKERYSAYYTFSIHSNDEIIYERFKNTTIDIKKIHQKELYKPDTEKQKDSLDSKEDFNSQNIIECIQRSDIYIDNNNDKKDNLYKQIFKYLSLITHPGLITPSKDEMIMQLALNAKFNSGCISRQVGAVVLNKEDTVKSIGWNEVPEGQIPCNLRSHNDLLNNSTLLDYSQYEKSKVRIKDEFKYIFSDKKTIQYKESNKLGLPDSFCFKQVQNKIDKNKNQVYTRSLHAEENAFLQLAKYGNSKIVGGQLFTTASPCFLCAKKAYQLGIRRVVYIEAYPDISNSQIFSCGFKKTDIVHFRGAIGLAYQKLYEPLFSYKDELKALNTQQNLGEK